MRFESGRENIGALELSKAYLAQSKYDLLTALNSLEIYQAQLSKVLGRDNFDSIEVEGFVPVLEPVFDYRKKIDYKNIAQTLPDYKKAYFNEKSALAAIDLSNSVFYPSFDLTQSAARLTTYAGKMDILKVASENVKEEIGKGIVDALDVLSKDTSIQDTAIKMENLGKTIADVITGVGVLIAELQKIPGVKQVQGFLFDISVFGSLARLGRMEQKPAELPFNKQRSAGRISAQMFRTEVRQQKELDRLRALEIAELKAKTEVDKLKDKFDLERIGLTAALNAATDEETKLRIRAQLAILDNNEALAKKYNAELESSAASKLAAENARK